MMDACQKEIDSFYGRYANAEGITIAEAKKRIAKHDVAAFERKAARYVEERNFSKRANEDLRLYNATMRINRLEMLKANIGLELIAGHDELEQFMGGILKGRTEDELLRQAGILGKTIKSNAQTANAIVNASFHNAKFSDRVWMYQGMLRDDLDKLLQQGLIQGKNPRVLAREIKQKFEASTYNAERLMRTELARVQTEAQKQSFVRNGFDMYEFIVNGGCCPVCEALKGKHFKVAKMMPGENAPPMHPHCRCSTAAWEDSEEYNAWLSYLEQGGTTKRWNNLQAAKLAADASANDWAKTMPRTLTKAERNELVQYAASKGIHIPGLKQFDGDPQILKSEIDELGKVAAKFPIGKKITLSVSRALDDEDFAATTGAHITINAKALRNRKITEQNLAAGGLFASTRAEDIVVHEYGHVIAAITGNKGLDIAAKAHYNVFGRTINTDDLLDYLDSNVSNYSTTFKNGKYTEVTSEVLSKNNSSPDDFTQEFVALLKGELQR